jgi:hypothetical protein
MLDAGRCGCGSRIFFHRQAVITTANGTIRDIPSVMILECSRCLQFYSVSTEPGKKTLVPFGVGEEGERVLFKAALKDWSNKDRPQDNASFIVLEPADEVDFARLGVPR